MVMMMWKLAAKRVILRAKKTIKTKKLNIFSNPNQGSQPKIKRVLLAVAQSRSRHIMHEASFCVGRWSSAVEESHRYQVLFKRSNWKMMIKNN